MSWKSECGAVRSKKCVSMCVGAWGCGECLRHCVLRPASKSARWGQLAPPWLTLWFKVEVGRTVPVSRRGVVCMWESGCAAWDAERNVQHRTSNVQHRMGEWEGESPDEPQGE